METLVLLPGAYSDQILVRDRQAFVSYSAQSGEIKATSEAEGVDVVGGVTAERFAIGFEVSSLKGHGFSSSPLSGEGQGAP